MRPSHRLSRRAFAVRARAARDGADTSLAGGPGAAAGANVSTALPDAAPAGARRRKLWELDPQAHGPLLGVCLPLDVLRGLARKVIGAEPAADGYELHSGMVITCRRKGAMAQAVQRELDRRYLPALRSAAAAAATPAALAAWWQAESATSGMPGALWATLTHPRITPALEATVLGPVRMQQFQLGLVARADEARLESLMDENAVLTRALAGAQQRCTRMATEHARQTEALQAALLHQRGRQLAAESCLALQTRALDAQRAVALPPDSRQRLAEHNQQLAESLAALQRELQAAHGEIERLQQGAALSVRVRVPVPQAEHPATSVPGPVVHGHVGEPAARLAQRSVLCVGGRTSSVSIYRRLIEDRGGRFLHHDGGEEDKLGRLDATLAAADLVICQAGCVSHNAYWRVKDHCKRTGKRCVFVDTPSAAGLQRALARMAE